MATFNDATVGTSTGGTTPDYDAIRASAPKIRATQFGDGYTQRLKFGLNINPRVWTLKWTAKDSTDADAIEAFFDARSDDGASFDWTPLDESTSYKWICMGWAKTIPYTNRATIQATFQQVFEP